MFTSFSQTICFAEENVASNYSEQFCKNKTSNQEHEKNAKKKDLKSTILSKLSENSQKVKTALYLVSMAAIATGGYFLKNHLSSGNTTENNNVPENYIDNAYYECFSKICSLLSVGYIASYATLSDNGVSGQINGQRNISFDLSYDKTKANVELYKIFDWIFSEGNSTDKLLLARNIISLHCKYTSIDATDEKTFASIKSNYQLYLKENANQYIEAKNKLSEYICDVVAKLGDDISGLFSGLKNNLIAIVSFFLTVVLVNIVSEQPLNNIFTKEITVIIELVLAGSVVYYFICRHEIQLKRKKNKRAYSFMKENYKDVFSDEELNQIFNNDKLIEEADKELKKGIRKDSVLWWALLILILISVELISASPIIIQVCKSVFYFIKHWLE